MVQGLQKQQKTIQAVIADQRQKDAAINAQIDRLIAQEVAKARARAAAAAKKRAEELARSIYDGEVSAVFGYGGMWNVLVRHGAYISVYCNLKSVSVHKGQKVSTRQALGAVGADNILQFQLRKETAKLNPEAWLGR